MEQKTKIVKTLTKDGWEVKEVPVDAPEPAGTTAVPTPPPPPPVRVTVADVPLSIAQEVLKAHGFVALPLEDIEALPKTHRDKLLKGSETAPAAIDDAALVDKVRQATSMEDLDSLLDGVTSPSVIAAAEEKAAELAQ